MAAIIMIRYGEIALKGKNRHQFEQQLQNNLQEAVKEYLGTVEKIQGRFLVQVPKENLDFTLTRLSKVFGVVSLSSVKETTLELEAIKAAALEMAGRVRAGENTFRIETRRSNKNFPYPSPELNGIIGSYLLEHFPDLIVNLDHPGFTLSIEISSEKAYLYLERIKGPGGLPAGISGKALLLLSGGIDSPVAGWLAMKRGLALESLHFHSFPFTSQRSQQKAIDLCRKLTEGAGNICLHMINLAEIQKEIKAKCPEDLGIILLRRMMLCLAEKLSAERALKALVTGESLGQVASQTLESIAVTEKATDMLILRPLLGMDKKEIIDRAVQIETYDISIRPYEDCCTLFLPRSPVTKPKLEAVVNQERKLDLHELTSKALKSLETVVVKRQVT